MKLVSFFAAMMIVFVAFLGRIQTTGELADQTTVADEHRGLIGSVGSAAASASATHQQADNPKPFISASSIHFEPFLMLLLGTTLLSIATGVRLKRNGTFMFKRDGALLKRSGTLLKRSGTLS